MEMKKILFVLPILTVCFASCEKDKGTEAGGVTEDGIIIFKDQNFLNALLDIDGIDANRDGQISVDEASKVTELDVCDCAIKDMSEIKYFTSLAELDCSENLITTLDLSGNPKLESLSCYYNLLTDLNVSGNAKLTYLECDENNLTRLDVSKCPYLTELRFAINQISTIDVSNNPELIGIFCDTNPLTVLDLGKNRKLEWFNVVACKVIAGVPPATEENPNPEPEEPQYEINEETKCPLESLILNRQNNIDEETMLIFEMAYPDLEITYVD